MHVAYPPDTDTDGFKKENETKPKENTEISNDPAVSAETVASLMLDGLRRGLYHLPNPDPVQVCSSPSPSPSPSPSVTTPPLLHHLSSLTPHDSLSLSLSLSLFLCLPMFQSALIYAQSGATPRSFLLLEVLIAPLCVLLMRG